MEEVGGISRQNEYSTDYPFLETPPIKDVQIIGQFPIFRIRGSIKTQPGVNLNFEVFDCNDSSIVVPFVRMAKSMGSSAPKSKSLSSFIPPRLMLRVCPIICFPPQEQGTGVIETKRENFGLLYIYRSC